MKSAPSIISIMFYFYLLFNRTNHVTVSLIRLSLSLFYFLFAGSLFHAMHIPLIIPLSPLAMHI